MSCAFLPTAAAVVLEDAFFPVVLTVATVRTALTVLTAVTVPTVTS
ncbi:TPA: hypothetical protein ACVO16_004542 [Vibrio diabolicus]